MNSIVLKPEWLKLGKLAACARASAYAPYSRFTIGAAVLSEDGRTYTGSNVENASYGLTICAERIAIGSAIASGSRKIIALAVSAIPAAWPCGACRQVLAEFAGPETPVIIAEGENIIAMRSLSELLPEAFTGKFAANTGCQ